MPSTKVKVGAGVVSAGVLGGMGYGIHALTNNTDSVKNYLEKAGFEIIEESNDSFWTKVLETYKLEKEGFEIKDDDITDPSVIRDWCRDNLKEKIKSDKDPLLKKASKWCVDYQTIEEVMGGTESNPQKLASRWNDLEDDTKKLIDGVTNDSDNTVNGEKIKEWCDINKKRRSSEDDEESLDSKLMEICVKVNGN